MNVYSNQENTYIISGFIEALWSIGVGGVKWCSCCGNVLWFESEMSSKSLVSPVQQCVGVEILGDDWATGALTSSVDSFNPSAWDFRSRFVLSSGAADLHSEFQASQRYE